MDIFFLKIQNCRKTIKGLQLVDDQLRYDNMDAATKIKYNKYQKDLLVSKDMLEDAWKPDYWKGS